MKRLQLLALVLVFGGGGWAVAQSPTSTGSMEGLKVQEVHPLPTLSPFPLDRKTERVQSLVFLSPEAMSAADRELVEANQGEIARRAALQGFHLHLAGGEDAGWDYEQAVCPVFPDHLVLEYSRSNGPNDVSLFSAVIPRGEGHVRVIPVERRSYSLWTPVASNALTLNDFNHMVTEGHRGLDPDWLTLGLCYAALAGGHVRAALQAQDRAEEKYPLYRPAMLSVSRKGGAQVSFGNGSDKAERKDWELIFAQSGRLLKVNHKVAKPLVERPVVGGPAEVRGVPTKVGGE